MDKDIIEALRTLDPTVDDHWTDNGAPALEPVRIALGRVITRKELTSAAPDLTRDTFAAWVEGLDAQAKEGGDEEQVSETKGEDPTGLLTRRSELEALEGKLAIQIAELNGERNKVIAELDEVIKTIEEEDLRVNPMARTQEHIRRQKEERAKRVLGDAGPSVFDQMRKNMPKQSAYTQGATVKVG